MSLSNSIPTEIWEIILSYLYPSQLWQMSRVNKNLKEIVSSLEVWLRMFVIAHGPKAHLRALAGIPRSESCMIFTRLSRLHICERCFGLAAYNADDLFRLPQPMAILLPRRSTDAAKYVGDRFDPDWTIRMCLPCRQGHILDLEEPVPRHVANLPMHWDKLCEKYPCAHQTSGLRALRGSNYTINELIAFNHMRQYYGGDIGMQLYASSTDTYDEKTETRIRWYQSQP
ncbi:hypothetical protein BGZ83_007112 [Gryganskiella cystojenkinii]|nr:hypothetical protein BGZ83_007112 [Gryganskiella cystojenkinii]